MIPLRTEIATNFAQLEDLASQWNRLWETGGRQDLFTHFAWARAAWRARGPEESLCAPVVFAGERLIAVLPLILERRELRFLGSACCAYHDVLCEPEADTAVDLAFKAILDVSGTWDRCTLTNIPEDAALAAYARRRRAKPSGIVMDLSFSAFCSGVVFAPCRERALRAIVRKKSLRRHENKLTRLGRIRLRHVEDREEIRRHLPLLFRQHIARAMLRGERSLFCDERNRRFHEMLVEELDPEKQLRFAILEAGDRPVAYHFGLEDSNTLLWYRPTFDPDLWDFSPGEVLVKRLFEYAAAKGLFKFDFTVGDEAFKLRFANHFSRNFTLRLYRTGPRGHLRRVCDRAGDWMRQTLPRTKLAPGAIAAKLTRLKACCVSPLHALDVVSLCGRLAATVWRLAVFSREDSTVLQSDNEYLAAGERDLAANYGTLTDLACLAAEGRSDIPREKLVEARERLRHGERLLLVQGKPFAFLASNALPRELDSLAATRNVFRELGERPRRALVTCLNGPPSSNNAEFSLAFQAVVRRLADEGFESWVWCRPTDQALFTAAIHAQFRHCYRICRTKVFGRWRMERVNAVISDTSARGNSESAAELSDLTPASPM